MHILNKISRYIHKKNEKKKLKGMTKEERIRYLSNKRPLVLNNSTAEEMKYGIRKRAMEMNNGDYQLKKMRKMMNEETVHDKAEEMIELFALYMIRTIHSDRKNILSLLDYDDEFISLYKDLNNILNKYTQKDTIFDYKKEERYNEYIDFNRGNEHKHKLKDIISFFKGNEIIIKEVLLMNKYVIDYLQDMQKKIISLQE